jgi:hypothetical protein
MKTFFAKNSGRLLGLATMAMLALTAPVARAVIIPVTPVGQWDCLINGAGQTGIIFLNFTEDIDPNSGFPTFEGIWVQAGHQKNSTGSSGDPRGTGTGRATSSSTFTNLFGGAFIHGVAGPVANNGGSGDWLADSRGRRGDWFYNSKGQVVGSFFTVVDATSTVTNFFQMNASTNFDIPLTNGESFPFSFNVSFTNEVLNTNVFWGFADDGEFGFTNLTFVNTNFATGLIGITNNVSFVGKVVLGKRLTLVGNSAYGKFTITGVPLAPITTGLPVTNPYLWTGIKRQDGNKFAETFNLTDGGLTNLTDRVIINVFGMTGQGPSYSFNPGNSFCMISAKKRIGFTVEEIPQNGGDSGSMRATVGTFINTSRAIGGKTVGDTIQNLNGIGFDAFLTPFIP